MAFDNSLMDVKETPPPVSDLSFRDWIKKAEDTVGLKPQKDVSSAVKTQKNVGYGVNINTPGAKSLIKKLQAANTPTADIEEALLTLALQNETKKSIEQYHKNVPGRPKDAIPYKEQPEIVKQLLTELAYNSAHDLTAKKGWPKLLKAAQRGDYETVAKEMYLSVEKAKPELKAGTKRRNRLRKEYFQKRLEALADDTSPASNIAMAQNAFSRTPAEIADAEQKLQKLRAFLEKQMEGRTVKEQRELEQHLKELEAFKKTLNANQQELRTGNIQEKDIKNYKLNMNPVYKGKDSQRNRRNI